MRVLMVGNDTTIVESRQGKFARVLDIFRRGWERVDIVLPRARNRALHHQIGNAYFHLSPWRKMFQTRFVAQTVEKLLAEYQHDLILLHSDGLYRNAMGVWWVWRKTGVPVVSEVHHVPGYPRAASASEAIQCVLAQHYIRWAKRHVVAFRTVNHRECPDFLARYGGVPQEQILVVPSVFVEKEFYPRDAPKKYDLMFCGRLALNKGLDLLLQAFALIKRKRPASTLLVKGEGPLEASMKREARRLGIAENLTHVRWVDTPDDLAQLYSQARVLVCSSYNEGGPRVTVEAMACGVPAVSTRVGIMNELIADGENGLLADWSPTEIAERCLTLLDNPTLARTIGEQARASVSNLTAESVVGYYITAVQGVAQKRKQLFDATALYHHRD
jgi:glycosyltransferase involved in cell wall biosynthesis